MIKSGCEIWEDCFSCPHPDCLADSGLNRKVMLLKAEAIRLVKEGYSPEQIANRLDRSVRQVERYLATPNLPKNLTNFRKVCYR